MPWILEPVPGDGSLQKGCCERIRKYVGTKNVNRLNEDRVRSLRCIRSRTMGTILLN